jgi:hypothetical protein
LFPVDKSPARVAVIRVREAEEFLLVEAVARKRLVETAIE